MKAISLVKSLVSIFIVSFLRNPYDLGWVENFKEAFDAHGKFWVVTWMVPSRQKKRGSGFLPPRRPKPQPDKAVTDDGGELGV